MESKKYPRIPHLPYSPGRTQDDRRLDSTVHFFGQELVILEKMDGSNLGMTCEALYARSHEGPPTHPSFDRAKALHARVRHLIPPDLTVFGEWCFARHSIHYQALPNYFIVFGARNDREDKWWGWEETTRLAAELDLPTVPFLATCTPGTAAHLKAQVEQLATQPSVCGGVREGIVVRCVKNISGKDWERSIAKWVRADHVQTDEHWKYKPIVPNKLAHETRSP